MSTPSKCACGRRKSRYLPYCKRCDAERTAKRNAEYRAILATGACPSCGGRLRRNLSISGWWQCEQLGAPGFRADATRPACDFEFILAKEKGSRHG